jgi:hypothetical protein
MRDANGFQVKLVLHHAFENFRKLAVRILVRIRALTLSLTGIIVEIVAAHRTETLTIALACVLRFELCLLSRRNKMRVFFQILDNFFGDNFTLETAQGAFNRFVVIN